VFFSKNQDESAPNFFQHVGKKLFITTCIEKQCIRPLNKISTNINATSGSQAT